MKWVGCDGEGSPLVGGLAEGQHEPARQMRLCVAGGGRVAPKGNSPCFILMRGSQEHRNQ